MYSPAVEAITGPFGNPNTILKKIIGLDLRKNELLEEAEAITHALINDKKPMHVARDTTDLMAFGVGSMIAKMVTTKIIENPDQAYQVLHQAFTRNALKNEKALRFSRRTVLATLKENGVIPEKTALKDVKPAGSLPNTQEIGRVIEEVLKIPLSQIQSSERSQSVIRGRFYMIWVMRFICGHSLTHIGKQVGGRDHTSVINGINQLTRRRERIDGVQAEVDNICDAADLLAIRRCHQLLINQLPTSRIRRIH
jgi:hypothetical protein